MSSPRRSQQSATPKRSVRGSQPPVSSPLAQQSSAQKARTETSQQSRHTTPRGPNAAANRLGTSSPLFFRSSSAIPSDNDSVGDRTPRASALASARIPGGSSPINYGSSSSPVRSTAPPQAQTTNIQSDDSALFLNSPRSGATQTTARNRRGDVSSDYLRSDQINARMVDSRGMPLRDGHDSSAATFSNLDPNTSEANALGGASERVLWGSNVPQTEVHRVITDFLQNFEPRYRMIKDGTMSEQNSISKDDPSRKKTYISMMKTMLELSVSSLNVDFGNLKAYPPTVKLWHQLQDFPNEVIHLFDNAIKEMMINLAEERMVEEKNQAQNTRNEIRARNSSSVPPIPSSEAGNQDENQGRTMSQIEVDGNDLIREVETKTYRVRPFGLDKTINLRDLNPGDIDRIVSVKGLVIRTTPVIPDMRDAFFQCSVCGHTIIAEIDRGKISEPSVCPREACKSPNSMQIIHNRSAFANKQIIKLQETPDSVPDGQTPHAVSICAYDELVDFCKAGDRVEITGIFKCNSVRINPRQRSVKNVYKTFVDALHIQKVDKRRLGVDVTTIEQELAEQVSAGTEEVRKVTEEEEAKIKETAARSDLYDLLARSLAPSIYEMDDVKKGILLQLFGGTNKTFEKGGNPKYRGDINVLLCGDPSTSKSQLLQYVHKIAPRGIYTSGKGSSAVGLTAYVTRDPETRQLVLESGALVLSDGGVCCIDEFDKMSDSTRSVLHEVMEQQTVSIAKAGIITTLNARTSILASANPIGSKYNPNLPVPQNIDLPPTLLSRFDLVYLVLDRVDEQADRRLAKHLVSMYLEDTPENANASEVLPVEFLTSYISYARAKCQPRITQAASEELVRAYVEMRKLGEDVRAADRRITATTRQLESMIRLAEAHAKMRLSDEVTAEDVLEAVRLIKSALKQAATDARTGLIDMSLLTEGTSASQRRRKQDLKNAITTLLDELTRSGESARYSDLSKKLAEQSSVAVTADELSEALRSLQQEGQVQLVGEGARRAIRRITGV